MAKPRVHEIAKELGIPSKELLAKLKELGEFVRSASSTIESPVVRKLREIYAEQKKEAEPEKSIKPAAKSVTKTVVAEKTEKIVAKPKPVKSAPKDKPSEGVSKTAVKAVKPMPKPGAGRKTKDKADPEPLKAKLDIATPAKKEVASESKPAMPRPMPHKPNIPRPPMPRPGGTGGLPAAHQRKSAGAPRPGNNPFSSSQGMGQSRRSQRPGGQQGRPNREGTQGRGERREYRSGSENRSTQKNNTFGTAGMPRPNPAMMPKQQSPSMNEQAGPGRGRGGSGRGRSWGGGRGNGPNTGGPGGPQNSGRGGRGTQGAFGHGGAGKRRKSKRQRRQEFDQMEAPMIGGVRVKRGNGEIIKLRRGASLTDLAEKIGVDAASLVQVLFHMGEMVTATQTVSDDTLEILGAELNYKIQVVSPEDEDRELLESFDLEFGEDAGDESDLVQRPPVVTVMGHVDHGKTKLLDALRHTNMVAKEAGGITQAIGAYQVETKVEGNDRKITFIDTPGHEAFTAMRARGAKSTDIAVLVVAADDGVMPQTIEALNHAKAANIPIVVAVNKIDKPNADATKVRGQLSEFGLVPEEYGGDTQFVDVSAVTREGLDKLLEAIVLTADAELDLRANPNMPAQGVAIEAHLDKGRGSMATVLIHRGTLHIGDSIVAGSAYGRVRALLNDRGENVDQALPSMPVQVLGLTSVPGAGDNLLVVDDDRMARQIAEKREARMRAAMQAKSSRRKTLDQLFEQLEKGETEELLLILKGDGSGSVEALEDALSHIDVGEEVSLRVIDRGVGAITETNVSLAAASKAVIIGFNVRATAHAAQMAERENVDIRYYSVIYDAIDEIESALKGMLKPIYAEEARGSAEIRQIFRSSKVGVIAGCMIKSGSIKRNQKARLLRDDIVIIETSIASLRREKDDVTEVKEGFECGITLNNYSDIRVGDIIETYEMVEQARE